MSVLYIRADTRRTNKNAVYAQHTFPKDLVDDATIEKMMDEERLASEWILLFQNLVEARQDDWRV